MDPELSAPHRKRQKTEHSKPKDKEKENDKKTPEKSKSEEKVTEKHKEKDKPAEPEKDKDLLEEDLRPVSSPPPTPSTPSSHSKSKHSEKSHSKHRHHSAAQPQAPPPHVSKAEQIYPMLLTKMTTIETLLEGSLKMLQQMVENMQSDVRQGLQSLQDRVVDTNHDIAVKLTQLQRYQSPIDIVGSDTGPEQYTNHYPVVVHQQPSPLHQGFDSLSGPVDPLYSGDDGREDL
jgi:hypothetical protein